MTSNTLFFFGLYFFFLLLLQYYCLHLEGVGGGEGGRVFIAFPYLCHNVSVFMNQFTIVLCRGGGTQQESYLTGSKEGS